MDIEKKLAQLKSRFEELGIMMSDPDLGSNPKKFTELTKEYAELKTIVEAYDKWKHLSEQIEGNKLLYSDPDLGDLARMESEEFKEEKDKLEEEIKMMLVPKDPDDSKNAIIEIRAGTGGDEAGIFAGDLFSMYRRYAESQRWTFEILGINEAQKGGFKEVSFMLSGNDVFGKMKFESGVHRVQRVPATESQGRVHTSAATVAVLPEVDEVDIHINPADLEVDTFRASGAGGQHVNKTDSAIRIRHVPSGVVVECQEERSQHKNRDKAMTMLRVRLYEAEFERQQKERAADRKSQVSTGDRSAKIRTYNFPQGRLTDHRINLTLYNLDEAMKGDIGAVVQALRVAENLEKLQAVT